mmetsp:Transcript_10434/g.20232  ORF Transcript_10434/g.20232 Transcript_10434/m.20232 type:complete len:373 (-) Transcript_10434:1131-2249(-)
MGVPGAPVHNCPDVVLLVIMGAAPLEEVAVAQRKRGPQEAVDNLAALSVCLDHQKVVERLVPSRARWNVFNVPRNNSGRDALKEGEGFDPNNWRLGGELLEHLHVLPVHRLVPPRRICRFSFHCVHELQFVFLDGLLHFDLRVECQEVVQGAEQATGYRSGSLASNPSGRHPLTHIPNHFVIFLFIVILIESPRSPRARRRTWRAPWHSSSSSSRRRETRTGNRRSFPHRFRNLKTLSAPARSSTPSAGFSIDCCRNRGMDRRAPRGPFSFPPTLPSRSSPPQERRRRSQRSPVTPPINHRPVSRQSPYPCRVGQHNRNRVIKYGVSENIFCVGEPSGCQLGGDFFRHHRHQEFCRSRGRRHVTPTRDRPLL